MHSFSGSLDRHLSDQLKVGGSSVERTGPPAGYLCIVVAPCLAGSNCKRYLLIAL